jgi:catechol 2,3-dioxygenase-like lactoylglutathione lyase family enzyme
MSAHIFNHIGILVHDLDEAKQRFAFALGLTFTDNVVTEARYDGDVAGVPMRFCYSYEGPPHIELIEASSDLYVVPGGEGVHHVGFAEDDVDGRVSDLTSLGFACPVTRRAGHDGNRMYTAFTEPAALHGVRCELTWAGRGPALERVIAQAKASGVHRG